MVAEVEPKQSPLEDSETTRVNNSINVAGGCQAGVMCPTMALNRDPLAKFMVHMHTIGLTT